MMSCFHECVHNMYGQGKGDVNISHDEACDKEN